MSHTPSRCFTMVQSILLLHHTSITVSQELSCSDIKNLRALTFLLSYWFRPSISQSLFKMYHQFRSFYTELHSDSSRFGSIYSKFTQSVWEELAISRTLECSIFRSEQPVYMGRLAWRPSRVPQKIKIQSRDISSQNDERRKKNEETKSVQWPQNRIRTPSSAIKFNSLVSCV